MLTVQHKIENLVCRKSVKYYTTFESCLL